jgi:peptide/nickel transport system permease protein
MGLKALIVRRVILAVPVAIGVVTLIFVMLSAMTPIMRVAYFVGPGARDLTRANLERLIHSYGLDQPIFVQYVDWLNKIIHLDFGRSLSSGGALGPPALSVVLASLPPTLELILCSVPFIVLFSIWFGTKAAVNYDKKVDYVARVLGILGTSVPVFVVAQFLIALCLEVQNPYHISFEPFWQLSYHMGDVLNLRIAQGTFTEYTGMITLDAILNGNMQIFLDALEHLILPVAVLVFTQCAALIRVTRSGLLEELGKPYIVSAMTKGLSKEEAVYKHARKNASISVLTISGLLLSNMFVSLMIVEEVFVRPGFASLTANAAITMNTPVLFTCAIFIALFFVFVNLALDILYEYLDPRIRL